MKGTMRFMSLVPLILMSSGVNSANSYLRSNKGQKSADQAQDPSSLSSSSSSIPHHYPSRTLAQHEEEEVVKFDYYDCSPNIVEFQSVVFMEFNRDISNLTDTERISLEQGFQETYNSLNTALCDQSHHRYITDVTLEWPPRRRLQENTGASLSDFLSTPVFNANGTKAPQEVIAGDGSVLTSSEQHQQQPPDMIVTDVARFFVNVACHNCPTNSSLFSLSNANTSTTTSPTSIIPSLSTLTTISQGRNRDNERQDATTLQSDVCACVRNERDPEEEAVLQPFRAPTAVEFQQAFNLTVGVLNVDGILQGDLDEVEELVEVDVVNCSSNVQQFSSNIVANLQGNPELMTPEERLALERGFLETYNSLTFARCDRFFRQIVQVKLISAQDRRRGLLLEDDFDTLYNDDDDDYGRDYNGTYDGNTTNASFYTNTTTSPRDKTVVPAVYQVLGECRDCVVSDTGSFNLFDDVFRRALSETQARFQSQPATTSWLPADTMTSPFHQDYDGGHYLDHGRQLLEPASVCLCPANAEQVEPTAPSDKEFQEEYSAKVEMLQEEGTLTHVEKVEDVANDEDVCDEELSEENGIYFVSFNNALKGAASDDKNLEDAFRYAYRSLGRSVCGPLLSEVEGVEENNEEQVYVTFSVVSLQTIPGAIFFETQSTGKDKDRDEEDSEEERFVEAFNEYLNDNRLSAQALSITYTATLAPTMAPNMKLTNVPVPVISLPPTNDTSVPRQPDDDDESPKPTVPSNGENGQSDNSPTTTPDEEGTQAPTGSRAPTRPPTEFSLPPLVPPTSIPFPTIPTIMPTVPATAQPTTVNPATTDPGDLGKQTLPPGKFSPRTTLLPVTAAPTTTNPETITFPPTPRPTTPLNKVVDDIDEAVADIVEDIGATIEEIVGYVVPILEDVEEFLNEVDTILEELIGTGLPDIPGLGDLLEHVDEQIEELDDASIPGLPETTKRLHETIRGILGLLLSASANETPSPTQIPAVTPSPTQIPAVTAPPSLRPTLAPTIAATVASGKGKNSSTKAPTSTKAPGTKGKSEKLAKSEWYDYLWAWPTPPAPTPSPTNAPTSAPTTSPPTAAPVSALPTVPPTAAPVSARPTLTPTSVPVTVKPTLVPTTAPATAKPTSPINGLLPPVSSPLVTTNPDPIKLGLSDTGTLTPGATVKATKEPTSEPTPSPTILRLPSRTAVLANGRNCLEIGSEGESRTVSLNEVCSWSDSQLWAYEVDRKALFTLVDGVAFCLEPDPISADLTVRATSCTFASSQEWTQDDLGRYVNGLSGSCLTGETTVDGIGPVSMAECLGVIHQQFVLVDPADAATLQSAEPSTTPSSAPTIAPTSHPTVEPTVTPTVAPTTVPTSEPTISPTVEPTSEPTISPTVEPTSEPTSAPTLPPTLEPTQEPTAEPTAPPTAKPTLEPTAEPTDGSTESSP